MNIIHVMKDGTTRDSIEGVVIKNDMFYQIVHEILKKSKSEGVHGK